MAVGIRKEEGGVRASGAAEPLWHVVLRGSCAVSGVFGGKVAFVSVMLHDKAILFCFLLMGLL